VIRFGLRLTLQGGREAMVRLVITAAAVALGAALLLAAVAGINAVNAQNLREAWLDSIPGPAPAAAGSQPLWWRLRPDFYDGKLIGRLDVAATGPRSPVPPGIPRLPGPGQYFASPALSKLIHTTPADQLGARFAGHQAGLIANAALPAPSSLLIIVGHSASQMSGQPGAEKITRIETEPLSSCYGEQCSVAVGIDANGMDLILSVVGVGLLLPVLIFIAAATRLSAARREHRCAAMRLTGATPRQISVIAAVESGVAAIAGAAAGFGLFFALRPTIASFPFSGAPFFTSDMSLSLADVLAVALGVPAAAAIVARIALRRVQISPLGVSRRVTPRPPRARRLIPLIAGLAELAVFIIIGKQQTSQQEILAIVPGFLLILAGLVIAGPWLTMVGARLVASRARRAGPLIAARRLADNPQTGFRTISGLTLALFVVTVTISVITSIDARRSPPGGVIGKDVLTMQIAGGPGEAGSARHFSPALMSRLHSIGGVTGVLVLRNDPVRSALSFAGWGSIRASLVSCAQLAQIPVLGRCAAGARVAEVPPMVFSPELDGRTSQSGTVWPAAGISPRRLGTLSTEAIAVGTNGSRSAIERARTVLIVAYPGQDPPATIQDWSIRSLLSKWQQLAYVLILVSLIIAGCTLAVSVTGSLSERKRPFSMLRLTGVRLGVLRQVVALETAVPLVIVAVVSTGAGLLAALLYVRSQLNFPLQLPGTAFYVIVLTGLAASLGVIAATLPLLSRITGPEVARNE
jgi:hypothetical protein